MSDLTTTRYGLPTLYNAVPFPGAPQYFVRYWDMRDSTMIRVARDGTVLETVHLYPQGGELVIVGYSCRSTYTEDFPQERNAWERRRSFPSVCFSHVEKAGEYGFTPADDVIPITRDALIRALLSLGVDWIKPEDVTRLEGNGERDTTGH